MSDAEPPRRFRKGQRIRVNHNGRWFDAEVVKPCHFLPGRDGGHAPWLVYVPVVGGERGSSQHLAHLGEDGWPTGDYIETRD